MKAIAEIKRAEREYNFIALTSVMNAEGKFDVSVASKGLQAISNIAGEKDIYRRKLGEAGVCRVVVNCMKIFGGDNKEVAEYGCASIRKLATDIDNRKSLGDLGACEEVVMALRLHGHSDASVAEHGCIALYRLGTGNGDNLSRLSQAGACEALAAVCADVAAKHSVVAEHSCRAISCLIQTNENQKRLGQAGICKMVVRLLEVFGAQSTQVVEQVSAAIRRLAMDETNREMLGVAGGCEAIMTVIDSLGLGADPRPPLHGQEMPAKIMAGSTSMSLRANASAAEQACIAIYRLSYGHTLNTQRLGQNGACEVVSSIAQSSQSFSSFTLAEWVCRAMSNLTLVPENVERLGRAGSCEAAVALLRLHGAAAGYPCEWACAALSNLAYSHDGNSERIGSAPGSADAFVVTLRESATKNAKIAETVLVAVSNLAYNNKRNSERFHAAGVCKEVVNVVRLMALNHTAPSSSGACASGELNVDANSDQEVPETIAPSPSHSPIPRGDMQPMSPKSASRKVAEQGCICISNLARSSDVCCRVLRAEGACEVVTAILKNYCTSSPSPAGLSLQGSMALLNLVLSGEDRDIRVELALQRQAAESIVRAGGRSVLQSVILRKPGVDTEGKARQVLELLDKHCGTGGSSSSGKRGCIVS